MPVPSATIQTGVAIRLAVFPLLIPEGVMLFAPSFLGGGDAVEYITLILIIVLYTIIAIKK